jgi:hypothetical protein
MGRELRVIAEATKAAAMTSVRLDVIQLEERGDRTWFSGDASSSREASMRRRGEV